MAGPILRKYGVQTTITFQLYETDGTDLKTDAAHASGDTKIMKDEGAEANTSNGFTDEGQGYSIVLTATEMQAARIVVYVVDAATKVWLDKAINIETYGNASAMHAFDFDTALAFTSGNVNSHVKAEDNIDFGATKKASINTEADTALTDYDPPTKAEMDTGHGLLATEAKQDIIDTVVDTILVDTGELQTDWANGGRLDLLIDLILADTGELQTDWANGGRLDLIIDACSTHAAADVLTENVEGTVTLAESIRLINAATHGKLSGGGTTTLSFRDIADSKNRLVVTVDANDNRTAVTRDDS